MSVTLKKEWVGESGYCNCLLVAMSRASLGKLELLSNQRVPNLEALVSRPDTHAWLRAQVFNYSELDTSKVIDALAGLGGITKSFWRYKAESTGSILVHDCVEDDGPVVERRFHLRLRRVGSVLSLTVTLDLSTKPALP